MSGLIETLLRAPADQRLFARADGWITAGDVRALAARAPPPQRDATIFLHTTSCSRFLAGLLAGAAVNATIALPAHAQSAYLAEIGCPETALLTDATLDNGAAARAIDVMTHDPMLAFFTSGSTGAPKRVEKRLARLEAEARALEGLWGADARHVVATVSHQHIYGFLFRIVWPLLSGRTADDFAATYWEDLEGRIAGSTLVSSPAHLTRLPPRNDLFAPPPGLIFSSGQLLATTPAAACIAAFGNPVTEVLGSTETGGIAWRRQTTPDAPWTPLPGVAITRDDDGALIVRSPFLQQDAPLQTGDVVDLRDDGRFQLKPRGDRVAKIDGKRVSLTRVEEALSALPEVDGAATLTLPERKDALAAVVALTDGGRDALNDLGAFRLSRRLRAALAATLESAERPKHWRFVDAIPVDAQGKRTLSSLRALFAPANPLLALQLDVRLKTETEAEIAFTLAPDLIFFEGHFPGRAILPGVAQAHLAVLIAQDLWGDWPSDANLARLKFRRVLLPGDAVVLKLKRDPAAGRLSFVYRFRDIDASQGEIGGLKR